MKTVIFDLDGTLANVDHRRRLKEDGSFDWRYFNDPSNIKYDTPNNAIVQLFNNLRGVYNLIIMTGRMGNINDVEGAGMHTRKWLDKYVGFNFGDTACMRPPCDYRKDCEVKEDWLLQLKDNGFDIAFAVDDRQQVVDMWRRNGVVCLQCAEGNF